MSNAVGALLTAKESSMIAEIVVSFSLLDEALCIFLLECPSKNSYLKKVTTEIKKDPSNVGIGKKIDLVVDLFPNNSTPCFKNIKSDLVKMRDIRNTVAHNSRFFFGEKYYPANFPLTKKYYKGEEPIDILYKEYEKCFKNISEFLKIIYSDWEYKKSFLYGIQDRA